MKVICLLKMKNKILIIILLIITVITLNIVLNSQKVEEKVRINNLHNGDAKFYKNDNIITTVNSKLAMYDLFGNLIKEYDSINANWIDCLSDENIIIYGNWKNEIGIVKLDNNNEIISNNIILTSDFLNIDPTIIKNNEKYYITITQINGTVNNSDYQVQNGEYTVKLYSSNDLFNWNENSIILKGKSNYEDIDVFYENGHLNVVYEQEILDKGKSGIYIIQSLDELRNNLEKANLFIR